MAQLGFLLPNDLQKRFDAYARDRGGRSAALRALVARALAEDGHEIAPLPPARVADNGSAAGVMVRLSADDSARLDEECRAMGMTRGQWLLSCARHRLHGSRQFGQVDRERIAKIVKEMRDIKMILYRYAGTLERSARDPEIIAKHHGLILSLAERISTGLRAIQGAFQGNDGYWRMSDAPAAAEGPGDTEAGMPGSENPLRPRCA